MHQERGYKGRSPTLRKAQTGSPDSDHQNSISIQIAYKLAWTTVSSMSGATVASYVLFRSTIPSLNTSAQKESCVRLFSQAAKVTFVRVLMYLMYKKFIVRISKRVRLGILGIPDSTSLSVLLVSLPRGISFTSMQKNDSFSSSRN